MMAEIKFTSEQKKALALNKNLIVTAGAGSGKTRILTARYLKIVNTFLQDNKYSIDNILMLTFTEKAALEMKQRVFNSLKQSAKEDNKVNWQQALTAFPQAQISTFHSFCAQILRMFPLIAELDPGFTVLEEYESELLLEEAFNLSLKKLQTQNNAALTTLLFNWDLANLNQNIKKMIRTSADFKSWQQQVNNKTPFEIFTHWFQKQINQVNDFWSNHQAFFADLSSLTSILQLPINCNDNGYKICCEIDRILNLPQESPLERCFLMAKLISIFKDSKGNYKSFNSHHHLGSIKNWENFKCQHQELKMILQQARDSLATFFPVAESEFVPQALDLEFAKFLKPLSQVYEVCLAQYENLKKQRGVLDFQDLEIKAHGLIKASPFVQKELQQKFRYIMVDEFQDTNLRQWELIKEISKKNKQLQQDKIFLVGDIKQSIYSFRGGDVSVFAQAKRDLEACGNFEEIVLSINFRSQQKLIAFYNQLFAPLMGSENLLDYEAPYQPLTAEPASKALEKVEVNILANKSTTAEEAQFLATKVEDELKKACPDQDKPLIAILLRRMTKVKVFENALRKKNINYQIVKGRGFYQTQEIYDIYNLLKFLNDPADEISLLAILRSPLLGLTDQQALAVLKKELKLPQFLQDCLKIKDHLSFGSLLTQIIAESAMIIDLKLSTASEQKLMNLAKIKNLARDFALKGASLSDFILFLEHQFKVAPKEGEANLLADSDVVIMSIHQAKGLEFPVVILPDLGAKFNMGFAEQLYSGEFQGRQELACKIFDAEIGQWANPSLTKLLKKTQERKALAEEKRLFYVSTTRAKEKLILLGALSAEKIDLTADYYNLNNFLSWTIKALDLQTNSNLTKENFEVNYNQPLEITQTNAYTKKEQQIIELSNSLKKENLVKETLTPFKPKKMVEISPTALIQYQKCPYAYQLQYQYYLGQKTALTVAKKDEQKTIDPRVLGNILHDLFENNVFKLKDLKQIQSSLARFAVTDQQSYYEEIKKHYHNLKLLGWGEKLANAKAIITEKPFYVKLANLNFDLDIYLTGYIDLLYYDGVSYQIIDFKTGAFTAEQNSSYQLQLACYLKALQNSEFQAKLNQEGLIIYTRAQKVTAVALDQKMEKKLDQLLFGIAEHNFTPQVGSNCEQCLFTEFCFVN